MVDEHRDTWAEVLDPRWHPEPGQPNGSVWPTLAAALWAIRGAAGFAEAVHDVHAVPDRWIERLFVPLPGFARTHTAGDLRHLAVRLDSEPQRGQSPPNRP